MKTIAIVAFAVSILLSSGGSARADGFVCGTHDGLLSIRVYNNTSPKAGTRTGAVMVVADKTVQKGYQTLGTFKKSELQLTNNAATYIADVQQFLNEGGQTDAEFIAGASIHQLSHIVLAINFSYANPVPAGQLVNGMVTLRTLDGRTNKTQVGCSRYLKNG